MLKYFQHVFSMFLVCFQQVKFKMFLCFIVHPHVFLHLFHSPISFYQIPNLVRVMGWEGEEGRNFEKKLSQAYLVANFISFLLLFTEQCIFLSLSICLKNMWQGVRVLFLMGSPYNVIKIKVKSCNQEFKVKSSTVLLVIGDGAS